MLKNHTNSTHSIRPQLSDLNSTLVPPEIVVRAGHDTVAAFAQVHMRMSNARNDQFAVGVSDFLDWLEDLAPGMHAEHIVEDNITAHLAALEQVGCSESELSARLCAIDLFLISLALTVPELANLPRSGYGRPCPPLLLVDSTTEEADFIAVYIEFLASIPTREREKHIHKDYVAFLTGSHKMLQVPDYRILGI